MRCIIAVDDPIARDTIAQAIASFDELKADLVELNGCREALRRRRYDFGFLTLRSDSTDSKEIWERLPSVAPELLVVALAPASAVSVRRSERWEGAFAVLGVPLDVVELYSTVRRLLDRLKKKRLPAAARPRAGGKRRGGA